MHGTHQTLPTTKPQTFHKNPRHGNIQVIKESLKANGQYRPIIVNKGTKTGRPYEVVAGNHTLLAAQELLEEGNSQFQNIDCWIIDVTEQQATRIVLADNRTADLGHYDNQQLLDLLDDLPDVEGTGYEDADIEMLQNLLDDAPDLDDLVDEYGELQDSDFYTWIRINVAPPLAEQWDDFAQGFDDPAEALEHLLDHGPDVDADA